MKNLRAILLLSSMAWLSACQQMPAKAPAPGGAAAPVEPVPSAVAPAPQAPAAPSGPVTAASQQQAQRTAMAAMSMLEAGHEEEAKAELQRALAVDPNNKLATNLLRQIGADPVATLGRESFSYTVRPNETLSMIAGRFMGDIYSFYILARYNNIAVPRLVAGGQTLRIPGKGPPPPTAVREPPRAEPVPVPPTPTVAVPAAPAAAPEPSVAERAMRAGEAAERRGDLEVALDQYQKAASLNEAGANAKADLVRRQLVQRHSLSARTAFAKQDLDGAIRAWDRVLRVDPANDNAKFERQRAMTLKEKAGKL
jgi:tetratricopeptide (TPR) repeat protein